uniref:Helix-turn-helix protein n=1 Tax=Siphoviridae sp. ctsxw88 TaxID=2825701 RepID=A0A8S5PG15_9CAUD|nr:MAG TPA: helix-turn-helix protein [Siphoviridae sp. ctsxw88]
MNLDFSSKEYEYLLTHCPFTDDEKIVFDMRRHGKSIIEISLAMNLSDRTVKRRISSIKRKILKEI